jgi:uncharacterized cupredoxin-like copper-binding protein
MRTFALIAAVVLLAGCPGNQPEDSSQNSPPRNSTSTQNPQQLPEKTATSNPISPPNKELPSSRAGAAATTAVDVQLTEYGIQMPDTLPSGQQRLKVANAGKENHNFIIEGPGVSTKLTNDLTRGDTAEIVVDLKPGSYTVYCPVDGHRGKGMQRTVTVR